MPKLVRNVTMKSTPALIIPCFLSFFVVGTSVIKAQDIPYEITDITWQLGPNLPEFRKGGCATVLDGKVISVFGMRQPWGEMATMYVYDPKTNGWQREKDAPLGQTYVQGAESGKAFFAIGGRSAERRGVHAECHRLSRQNGEYKWDRIGDLKERRAWAPSASAGSRLFVFGGSQGGHGPTLSSVEMLDSSKHNAQWQKISDMPGDSRGWSGAAAVAGKIYLLGGSHFFDPKPAQGPDRKRFNDVWQFDPDTRQWQARKPLPYRLSGFDCCVYKDRYIIVAGGCAETADFTAEMRKIHEQDRFYKSYYCPFVLVYDTQADQWHRLPSRMPVPTNDIGVVLHEDTLYALGGENVEPATSNTTPWLRIGRIRTSDTTRQPRSEP
ncbi:MAG: Kelch repeat-containing protein [Pirellulales bacterium]